MSIRVRFAPSPTGLLHVGNARTALFNWLFAKKNNGVFILRIEDTDLERSKEEYTQAMINELRWLGLTWDEGSFKQSERFEIYKEHLKILQQKGLAYECFCSPEELEERKQLMIAKGIAPRYDNKCRNLSQKQIEDFKNQGRSSVVRFKVQEDRKVVIEDIVRGNVTMDCSLLGDFVLTRSDGVPSFHFVVVVDDGLMKISHVIRGEDHLPNTPRHILLFEALGFKIPKFAHLPMILGPDGEKLSKRHGMTSVMQYREKGYLPEAINNYLALLGWMPPKGSEITSIKEMAETFSLEKVGKSGSIFDVKKLDWVSGCHIKSLSEDAFLKYAMPFIEKNGWSGKYGLDYIKKVLLLIKENIHFLEQISEEAKEFFTEEIVLTQEAQEFLALDENKKVLSCFIRFISEIENLDDANFLKEVLKKIQQELSIKGKALYMPLRYALIGKEHGQDLIETIRILGKDRCIKRLRK